MFETYKIIHGLFDTAVVPSLMMSQASHTTGNMYTVFTKKTAPSMFKNLQKLASFGQLQFNSINVCFSITLPTLVKICPTVTEILTFNKWSQKFTVSRNVLSY